MMSRWSRRSAPSPSAEPRVNASGCDVGIARDRHVVGAEGARIDGRGAGDAGREHPGALEQRVDSQQPAVAAAPDAHPRAVHVRQRFHPVDHRLHVVEVALAVVHQERFAEATAVADTAPHVHLHDDVALLHQVLL